MSLQDGNEVLVWGTESRWAEDYRGGPDNRMTNLERVIPPQTGRKSLFQIWSPEDIEICIHLAGPSRIYMSTTSRSERK